MNGQKRCPAVEGSEDGYILLALMIVLAVFTITLATAVPKVRAQIKHDQEIETMHRGKQYARAVQLYYRRFHRFPPSVEALLDTNGTRFLRRKYPDPLTGKDDWQPVLLGQNKAPLTMGLFGEVRNMGAAVLAGSGQAGADRIIGSSPRLAPGSADANTSQSSDQMVPGRNGGGQIIGFSPSGQKESILVYKTKSRYDEWEFVYDPASDRMTQAWFPPPSSPPTNVGAPGVGPNTNPH